MVVCHGRVVGQFAQNEGEDDEMKFIVEKSAFETAVSNVSRVVSHKVALPILTHIRFRTKWADKVEMAATDLERTLCLMLACDVKNAGDYGFTVPSRLLSEVVGSLPDGLVTVSYEGATVHISNGAVTFKLNAMPADDYPTLKLPPKTMTAKISQKNLRRALRNASVAIDEKDPRKQYTGICMKLSGTSLMCQATDGKKVWLEETDLAEPIMADEQVIIGPNVYKELVSIMKDTNDTIEFALSEGDVFFLSENFYFCGRVLEGQYTNLKRVVNQKYTVRVVLNKDAFLDSTKRSIITAKDKDMLPLVHFRLVADKLNFRSMSASVGEYEDSITVEANGNAEWAMNAIYLYDCIRNFEEPVIYMSLVAGDPGKPFRFVADEMLENPVCCVMPVRVNKDDPTAGAELAGAEAKVS